MKGLHAFKNAKNLKTVGAVKKFKPDPCKDDLMIWLHGIGSGAALTFAMMFDAGGETKEKDPLKLSMPKGR